MQPDNRLLDDLTRVATGAFSAFSGVRDEIETRMREQFERVLAKLDVVKREEFEAVRQMAANARLEQEALRDRLDALEARLAGAKAAKAPEPDDKPGA